jgi:excisionase family DNA binding protein
MTPAQVAKSLQVKERTVSQWLKTGKLRGTKIGRLWRVPEDSLNEFLGITKPSTTFRGRDYSDEEIAQFLTDDVLDEETARIVERLLAK